MTTALISHSASLGHVTPPGHPERVARIEAVNEALTTPEFDLLVREEAPRATPDDVRRAHPQSYYEAIEEAIPASGWTQLDPDTYLSPGSLEAALRGLGANLRAVDMVLGGEVANAFAAIRPPGHHAETNRSMGFCLFANAAIAAKHALEQHGLSRVAVMDFDVHHGNGTQNVLWDEARALYVSTHQMPLWPFTGAPEERGAHDNILNVPLPPHADGARFRSEIERQVLPRLDDFAPDLLIVSAGFDAHRADPLAQCDLGVEDFAWVTERLCDIAEAHCGGRVVSTLEGGYDLDALAASVAAHVRVLMERGA